MDKFTIDDLRKAKESVKMEQFTFTSEGYQFSKSDKFRKRDVISNKKHQGGD